MVQFEKYSVDVDKNLDLIKADNTFYEHVGNWEIANLDQIIPPQDLMQLKNAIFAIDPGMPGLTCFRIRTSKGTLDWIAANVWKKGEYRELISMELSDIQTLKTDVNSSQFDEMTGVLNKQTTDATFMRMKEDAMLNGQLKPAYNLQHGVDSEYVTWLDVFPAPTDTITLIPFLKDMEEHLTFKYKNIVADAGYESEENYIFIESNEQTAYIKPQNYELSKTRRFQHDISRRENMDYDPESDSYICRNGKQLSAVSKRTQKTATGYQREVTIYECNSCDSCPYKKDCIKGNNCKTAFEDRNKRLSVSRKMEEKRVECLERITSDYGTQLRMNRSIQAEGSFANVKEDMNFRRYLYRGKENVLAQSILLAIGYDINKLHHKIAAERTGTHLFELKKAS